MNYNARGTHTSPPIAHESTHLGEILYSVAPTDNETYRHLGSYFASFKHLIDVHVWKTSKALHSEYVLTAIREFITLCKSIIVSTRAGMSCKSHMNPKSQGNL